MQWSDDAIVLGARKHGESAAIVTLLTRDHGRQAGLVRGGAGRRQRGVYQTGNVVAATWRARLAEHLGTLSCELLRAYAADLMVEKLPLLALTSAAALVDATLPEREPHGAVFDGFAALLEALMRPDWPPIYVRWELAMLGELGYGLDLSECAATGANDGLVYVSPRTGRAVSAAAGEPYRDRLLPLPGFLLGDAEMARAEQIADGLALTGYFLERHVLAPGGRKLPAARTRLVDGLREDTTISGSNTKGP